MANFCTAADIILIGPEFADVPIPTIDLFITMAADQINENICRDNQMGAGGGTQS